MISKIKNENDINLLQKIINIKEFYRKLLDNSNNLKEFLIKIGQNDNSVDFILENISKVDILKTLDIIYNINYKLIDDLKKEIYEYKDLLFISKIKYDQIENIILKELLKNYYIKNFNFYEFTVNLIEKILNLNNKNVYNFIEEVIRNKTIFKKENKIINKIIADYIDNSYSKDSNLNIKNDKNVENNVKKQYFNDNKIILNKNVVNKNIIGNYFNKLFVEIFDIYLNSSLNFNKEIIENIKSFNFQNNKNNINSYVFFNKLDNFINNILFITNEENINIEERYHIF